jgi:mRNA degradation ribonuclease J1/J2
VIENGDVIDVDVSGINISDRIDIDHFFVDSESYSLLPHETLRERLRIGELGLVVVAVACDFDSEEMIGEPQIESYGLVPRDRGDTKDFERELLGAAKSGFKQHFASQAKTRPDLEESVRVEVRRKLFHLLRKKPVVVCKVIAV